MRIVQMQQQLSLRLDATTHPQLAEQLAYLPENQPVAFLTGLDVEADGCLVWEPDQKEPTAITPPESSGRHICGCFVACVPEQESCGGQVVEDGFVMMLTTKQWQSVRDALRKRQFMEIEATTDRLPLRIEWDRR